MSERGGKQQIPRPGDIRPGDPPPWAGLAPPARHLTLAHVRACLADAPPPRPAELQPASSRPAAVLLPLYEDGGEVRVVLTKRPLSMRSHRGEIAFPGGKRDPGDATLLAAALREADEEIGLDPETVEVVAELDSLSTVASQFTITPFVGVIATPPVLRLDPREVDAAFAVPISELLDPEAFREERWELWGAWRSMVFFEIPGETIWGATARILTNFLRHLVAGSPEPEDGPAGL